MTRRTIPLAVVVPIRRGSDPDVIEIDDCREVYGDSLDLFPAIEDHCHRSPHGQHSYCGLRGEVCFYCGKPSGLDE